jgi:ABC-type amino acid transport substrate-binding protein
LNRTRWCVLRARGLGTAVILLAAGAAFAQEEPAKLRVGTKLAAPFSYRDDDGRWTGISVELWREVAGELGVRFEFEERTLEGLLDGVRDRSLDVAVAALTVTEDRERTVDFTHPFFSSGLGIAVAARRGGGWLAVTERFFSVAFLKVLALLTLLLLVAGLLVWLFERKRNREQFGGPAASGIASGFWWSAVTMTTVGYGDKAPRTVGGRVVGLIWMFACIIVISGFTAAIASALTVSRLEGAVSGPDDLARVRVATVGGTTSEQYLRSRAIEARSFPSPLEALRAVSGEATGAMVYDAPILRHLVLQHPELGLEVLPAVFQVQTYAFALPEGSDLREALNRALLRKTSGAWWRDLLYRHLGR